MFDKASLLECLSLHKSAVARYTEIVFKSVNGTRLQAEQRLAQHERCVAILRELLGELNSLNRLLPTLDEVIGYGAELGLGGEECEDWFDWMSTFGWKLKGEQVMDWRAALRREKRGKIKRQQTTNRVVKRNNDPGLWREFLKERQQEYAVYRFAPGFLRTDFARWEKTRLVTTHV